MAPTQAVSFDAIIQAGRQKKKNEELAKEIFGKKGRRSSTPSGPRASFKDAGSLASRITKPGQPARATSSSSLHRAAQRPQHTQSPLSKRDLFEHLAHSQRPVRNQDLNSGLSIRGIAGPAVVVGQNFAPGTTAADIQSAMEAVGGELQSCTIINAHPTVTAEMVFADKANADNVILTFDNQKADGRILRLFLKKGPPTKVAAQAFQRPRSDPPLYNDAPIPQQNDSYTHDKSSRRADPEVQDGSFGFNNSQVSDKMAMDVDAEEQVPSPVGDVVDREEPRDEIRLDRHDDRGYGYDRRDDRGRRDNGHYSQGFNQRPNTREFRRPPQQQQQHLPQHQQSHQQQRDFRSGNNNNNNSSSSSNSNNRDGRGLYSDDMYSRPRGRGFR